MLLELSLRHLLGGRFSFFLKHRWKRWLTGLLAAALTMAAALWLGIAGSPFWGASSFFLLGVLFFFLRRLVHGRLPDHARGAYASAVTFVAVAGISLAVMTLIVVISVMDGFTEDIQKALLKTTPEVTVTTLDEKIAPWIAERISGIDGVVAAEPYLENDLLLQIEGYSRPLPIRFRGETVSSHTNAPGPDLLAGDWKSLDEPDKVFVGAELARLYYLSPGDKFWLVSPQGELTAMGMMPRSFEVEVAGIFRSGFYEVDQGMVIAGLETADRVLGMDGAATGIAVRGRDPFQAPELARRIEKEIPDLPLFSRSWAETRRNMYEAMQTEKIAMFIIESFLILIASFNISSTLFMAVGRKTREIGLLLAMGMSRGRVLSLFALEGILIGATGTALGLVTGVGFAIYLKFFPIHMPGGGSVYYIDTIPVSISWGLVVSAAACALVLSLLASIYPAVQAASLSPARALRYE